MHRMVNTMGSGKMRSDPCHGFFHALRYSKLALALDIMELRIIKQQFGFDQPLHHEESSVIDADGIGSVCPNTEIQI